MARTISVEGWREGRPTIEKAHCEKTVNKSMAHFSACRSHAAEALVSAIALLKVAISTL